MADDLVEAALKQKESTELDSVEELNDEALDKVIEEEDPEFAAKLKAIESDKLSLGAEELELRSLKGFQKIKFYLNVKRTRLATKIKNERLAFRDFWLRLKGVKKLIFVGSCLGSIAVFFALGFVLQYRILKDHELFVSNFTANADHIYELNYEKSESFYENSRLQQNLYLFPKIISNLKVSSEGQSMGAFEFFLEGISQDSILEMKEKESELKDLIQRVIEGFSFEELESPKGKQALVEQIQKEVSSKLENGLVKRVLIKNIILKPPTPVQTN